MLSYLSLIFLSLLLYLLYHLFISILLHYLLAGFRLGFSNIALLYHPLSTYSTLHKKSLLKYNNASGHIHQITRKYPNVKIIFMRVLGITHLIVCDPQMIKKCTFQYVGCLKKRQLLVFSEEIEQGLIFAEGEVWKKGRKLMSGMFHFDVLEGRENVMEEVINRKIKDLNGERPDLFKLGCSIGGQIVLKSLFGEGYYKVDFDGRNPYEQINQLMAELIATSRGIMNMIRVVFGWKLTRNSKIITRQERKSLERLLVFKEKSKEYLIEENQRYKKGETVSMFLKAYFELNQGDIFEQAVQQLFLFLLAGEDTTGALISSCLLTLSEHPQYQSSILSSLSSSPSLHSSKSLNNFIFQVNRLLAPVPNALTRKVISPFTISNYTFSTGSTLTLAIRSSMNNQKYWDDVEKFKPERWEKQVEYSNAYVPFSSGPRNCIGQHMAMMEVRLAIVRVLEKYWLEKEGETGVVVNKGVISLERNQMAVRFRSKEGEK